MAEVKGWDLEDALAFIRERQPKAMAAGFYLALGGGVLNNGRSDNDLDLLAVARTDDAKMEALVDVFPDEAGMYCLAADVVTGHYMTTHTWDGRSFDVVVIMPGSLRRHE